MTKVFLENYNLIYILANVVISIGFNYIGMYKLDEMSLYCTNYFYLVTMLEGINILISLIPTENVYILGVVRGITFILAGYIYITAYMTQYKGLTSKDENKDLESDKLSDIV
jgi:uncharacterized membrane protein HdeD (DUF308 family)